MGRELILESGERRRILWIYSSSIPGQIRFEAEPLEGDTLGGTVEVTRLRWLTKTSEEHALAPRHVIDKAMSDGDLRIYVTPAQRTRIRFETRHFRAEILFYLIGGMIAFAIIAGLGAVLLRSLG